MTLYKSVVTDRKVAFVEKLSAAGLQDRQQPVTLVISKGDWLHRGRPDTIEVKIQ